MSENKLVVEGINSKGFGIIPKLVMQDRDLSIASKSVYAYFCSYAGAGDTCFPTRKKICYDLCISNDSLSKYLGELIKKEYISCEQIKEHGKFSHNVYTINAKIPCPKISDTENSEYENADTKNNSNKNNNYYKNTNSNLISPTQNTTSGKIEKEKGLDRKGLEKENIRNIKDMLGQDRIYNWISRMGITDTNKIIAIIDSYLNKCSYTLSESKGFIEALGGMVDMRIKNDNEGIGKYQITSFGFQKILETLDKLCPSNDMEYKIKLLEQAISNRDDNVTPLKKERTNKFHYEDCGGSIPSSVYDWYAEHDDYAIYSSIGKE